MAPIIALGAAAAAAAAEARGPGSDDVDGVAPGVPSLVVWVEAFNAVADCRREDSTLTATSSTMKFRGAVEGCDCDVAAEDEAIEDNVSDIKRECPVC